MSESSANPPTELLRRLLEASLNSPLGEADPASLDELMNRIPTIFNKNPLDTSETDIADTMLYFRAKRAMFSQLAKERADAEPSKRGRKTTKPPTIESGDEV